MSRKRQEIDPINPVCGKRLRQLLEEYQIRQKDFAITVNQNASYICRLINGRQKMSPETARYYIKAAFDGKGIRWEWLAGFDDYKTEEDRFMSMIDQEESRIYKEGGVFAARFSVVCKMLNSMQYDMIPACFDETNRIRKKEFETAEIFTDILFSDNQLLPVWFSDPLIEGMRDAYGRWWDAQIQNDLQYENNLSDEELEGYLLHAEEIDKIIHENPQEWLNKLRNVVQQTAAEELAEECCLYDAAGNAVVCFSGREKEDFVNQLYDTVAALIQYHINKKKGQA